MGVSGSGKSTVAKLVARKINVALLGGDYLHPRSNIDKMSLGQPLTDNDRTPWLEAVNSAIYAMQHTNNVSILVCSSLKRKYRDALREGNKGLYFIYLKGNLNLITQRVQNRKDHFFKSEMIRSQFDILEEPLNTENDVYEIDISNSIDRVVDESTSVIYRLIND